MMSVADFQEFVALSFDRNVVVSSDCEKSLILAMAIVGRTKYTRARAKFREDETRGECQKLETTNLAREFDLSRPSGFEV